jgi:hypothetical protein
MEKDSDNFAFIQIVELLTHTLYILRHGTNIVYFRAKNVTNCRISMSRSSVDGSTMVK